MNASKINNTSKNTNKRKSLQVSKLLGFYDSKFSKSKYTINLDNFEL